MNRPDDADAGLFEFITNAEFKANLLSDYRELQAGIAGGLWKAVHVLAGSIIEAILIDYLIAARHKGMSEQDLLKWNMGQLIPAGQAEGILTAKSAQLCVVIKDYRNLIHPGRIIRLEEKVDPDGATVAMALVRMVARDIGKKKAETYGFTAEQIVTKLDSDHDCISILPHVLNEMNETEKDRLILEVLPNRLWERYQADKSDGREQFWGNESIMYRQCFKVVRNQVSWETKKKSAEKYLTILKEQTSEFRECYEKTFFRFSYLEGFVSYADLILVKDHILHLLHFGMRLEFRATVSLVEMADGIGSSIALEDITNKKARGMWSPVLHTEFQDPVNEWFCREFSKMDDFTKGQFVEDMKAHAQVFKDSQIASSAAKLLELVNRLGYLPIIQS